MLAERAVLDDMGVLSDPFARQLLDPSMAVIFQVVRRLPHRLRAGSVTLAGLAARVLWFDAQVDRALEVGIEQIVVVGAGYDSRAWRLRADGVQYFELDHGGTQRDKRGRAQGPGPIYVEADLMDEGVSSSLREHGLDAARPALFVVEGVTMYLDEGVVRRQLEELGRSCAPGSRLAVDFHPPRDVGTSRDRRQMRLQRMARAGSGESFRLMLDPSGAVELVETSGWGVDEATALREAARLLVPRASGLPVERINPLKVLVAASRS